MIYHSPNLVYSWVKWEYQSSYWDHLINFACSIFFPFSLLNYYASLSNKHNCIFCILHCVSWTTMHAWSTMDGPTWKGKLLLATQIVSYLMIKEQGGTSVALWTTNHTTERQQDYWTEVNCFSQPRHSTCSFSENIYTFKDFSLMSPERTTNKWRLYFQGTFFLIILCYFSTRDHEVSLLRRAMRVQSWS